MKTKIFKCENGLELIVKNRKSAVILEMNQSQMDSKYKVEFKFNSRDFNELYCYIDTAANESWGSFTPKEAGSLGSDYYEYYDKELDSNGYLYIRENTIVVDRPSLENPKLYQFNKGKMESFVHDFGKLVIGNRNRMEVKIPRIADTLISQSTMFNCTLKVAWKNYMHPAITEQVIYDDVISYINDKVKLGEECQSQ